MFNRKKLIAARSNFIIAYQELNKELANVKLIKPIHVGVVHLRRLYEEITDSTKRLTDEVVYSSSARTIGKVTEMIVSYTAILRHAYNYYYELNEDPNRFN